jgi:predicted transcriptional regulator
VIAMGVSLPDPVNAPRSIRIPQDLWDRVSEIADADDRSASYVVVEAIRLFVEGHDN